MGTSQATSSTARHDVSVDGKATRLNATKCKNATRKKEEMTKTVNQWEQTVTNVCSTAEEDNAVQQMQWRLHHNSKAKGVCRGITKRKET